MPPRSRARRSIAKVEAEPDVTPEAEPSTSRRATRGKRVKAEPEPEEDEDAEGEEVEVDAVEEDEEAPEPGPSRRGRTVKGRGRAKGRARKSTVVKEENGDETDEGDEIEVSAEPTTPSRRIRQRKSVSYREVPPEVEEEVLDDDAEGEEEELDGGEDDASAAPTPGRSRLDKPALEKVGSGRGGFSVKGAAAAAARARWAKHRAEKAERGEDSDDDRPRRRTGGGAASRRWQTKAADETVAMGGTITIKGKEYTMGDDELILPDNEKGDTKVDAEGRVLGGREYKLVTFTSESRRNPNRIYALTIDAARACGYTDSLAFLRRCPQIIKLACTAEERQMLIDIGRITGNLKHRMVTMVCMRNIYKMMGARVIKGGKWVTDDYDEDEALAKCAESGFTPYTEAHEEEIFANAVSALTGPKAGADGGHGRQAATLAPFYTLGGPTTTFGGNGMNPWSEAGWGNRRAKLRGIGIAEDDWMLKTAEDCRRIDMRLRESREERLVPLEGLDASRGWVYALEAASDGVEKKEESNGLTIPSGVPERKKSSLNQVEGVGDEEGLTPLPGSVAENGGDVEMGDPEGQANGVNGPEGGKIIVQTPEEERSGSSKWNWGLGSWKAGTVIAAYEPHTHMPHIPLWTQPHFATRDRISPNPLLASYPDAAHRNFVQSTVSGKAATGLASVEYVFEARPEFKLENGVLDVTGSVSRDEERKRRLREVKEAQEWEKAARKRRKTTA